MCARALRRWELIGPMKCRCCGLDFSDVSSRKEGRRSGVQLQGSLGAFIIEGSWGSPKRAQQQIHPGSATLRCRIQLSKLCVLKPCRELGFGSTALPIPVDRQRKQDLGATAKQRHSLWELIEPSTTSNTPTTQMKAQTSSGQLLIKPHLGLGV